MTGSKLSRFGDIVLMPLTNLVLAFVLSGLAILAIGENPVDCLLVLLRGAFGTPENFGYTLYYTTNVLFTGLAVAVAFHAGLFNIGGEGQAMIAGIGAALPCLFLDMLPGPLVILLSIAGAALFGAGWAAIPAYLQARRGSHIVITTIMFNFLAATVFVYLLVNVLIEPGQMSPQSREIAPHTMLPQFRTVLKGLVDLGQAPVNLSFLLALMCAFGLWLFLWHTPTGFALRSVGANPNAARFAGVSPPRIIMLAMLLSGALAGGLALNEVLGVHHRLLVGFTGGYGFTGIAVALMGRNHPVGIFLAALLFGGLYQGGAELAFDYPAISNQMVMVIQGLVILFTGALGGMAKPLVRFMLAPFARKTAEEGR